MVFVARSAEVYCRRGLGQMEIGRWVWIGEGNALRCHEGYFRVGDKVVLGGNNTMNGYLDIDVGDDCIFADWIYVTDFDHVYATRTCRSGARGSSSPPCGSRPTAGSARRRPSCGA